MKLYRVRFDGMDDYVEAENVAEAVRLWDAFNRAKDPSWDEGHTPEPDGIWPVESDNPVIRAEGRYDLEKMRALAQEVDYLHNRRKSMEGTIRQLTEALAEEIRKVAKMRESRAAHVARVSRRFKWYRTIIADLRRELAAQPPNIAVWMHTEPVRDLQAERDAPMGGSLPDQLVGVQVWTWRGNLPALGVVIEEDKDEEMDDDDPDPYYVVRFCSDVRKSIQRSRLFASPVDCALAEIELMKKRLERSEDRRKRETELLQKLRKRVSDHVSSLQKAMR